MLLVNKVIGLVFDKLIMKFFFFDNLIKIIILIVLYGRDIEVFYILGIKVKCGVDFYEFRR